MGATGLEPVTPSVSSRGRSNPSRKNKRLTATRGRACTAACTSSPEHGEAITVEALAAALSKLSPADRARLADLMKPNA